jgi:recombinational DNA repair ATPase RecF
VLDEDGRGGVVLLDDVLSELDERRAEALVGHLGSLGQALVTSTRAAPAGVVGAMETTSFRVEGGRVVRE